MQLTLDDVKTLTPARKTLVVDIGANPIDGDPPYKKMLQQELCTVIGFEPQEDALLNLRKRQGPNEKYLPNAIGDGKVKILNITAARGMTSIFEPDPERLALFDGFEAYGTVEHRRAIVTTTLDSIKEIEYIDFIKMDVQGAELQILQNGKKKLQNTVAIQLEISFVPLYKNQPTFGEIDIELRSMGFMPHAFYPIKCWPLLPTLHSPDTKSQQLLEADIVYIKDISKPREFSLQQWKHLALISHHCYNSHDLTIRALKEIKNRQSESPEIHYAASK